LAARHDSHRSQADHRERRPNGAAGGFLSARRRAQSGAAAPAWRVGDEWRQSYIPHVTGALAAQGLAAVLVRYFDASETIHAAMPTCGATLTDGSKRSTTRSLPSRRSCDLPGLPRGVHEIDGRRHPPRHLCASGSFAPFVALSKAEIARRGRELGVDFAQTWSCYVGGETHCGECGTCVERREAFILAGVPDPTRCLSVSPLPPRPGNTKG
jgi:hypothetical protein